METVHIQTVIGSVFGNVTPIHIGRRTERPEAGTERRRGTALPHRGIRRRHGTDPPRSVRHGGSVACAGAARSGRANRCALATHRAFVCRERRAGGISCPSAGHSDAMANLRRAVGYEARNAAHRVQQSPRQNQVTRFSGPFESPVAGVGDIQLFILATSFHSPIRMGIPLPLRQSADSGSAAP